MINETGTSRLQYGSRRQNPAPASARRRRDAGTAAAVTAQPEPARCIASLHFRRLSTAGCAAGGRNCRSRPAGGPLLQCYLGWRPHGDYRVVHCHDDVMTWKHCLSYWPFVMRIHRSLVVLFTKCHHCGVLIFSLMYQPSPNGFLWVRYHLPGITLHSISFVLLHFSHSPRHL